jgi:hypothetical protein
MSRHRLAVAALVAVGALAIAVPAQAAPPPNDNVADATVLTALPFQTRVDTLEATSQPTDPACDGPNSNSIWYRLTASVTGEHAVLTPGFPDPQLDLGVGVYTGRPGTLTEVACNNFDGPNVRWQAQAGTSYLIMISTGQGQARGFTDIDLTFRTVLPPIAVRFGVGDLRLDAATGGVFVPLTVRCTVPASLLEITVLVSQWRQGRLLEGEAFFFTTCPLTATRRLLLISPPDGTRFGRWQARLRMNVQACDVFTCDGRRIDRRVTIL